MRCACDALEPRRLLSAALLRDVNTAPVPWTPEGMIEFKGDLFMSLPGPQGRELYRGDGTPGVATLLKDINPGPGDSQPRDFTVAGGLLYFTAGGASGSGRNLWRTDGTEAGTVQLTGLGAPDPRSNPSLLTPVGDSLYFAGRDPLAGEALLKTDGTVVGTRVVFDPPGTSGDVSVSAIEPAADASGRVFFATSYYLPNDNARLWSTDGTPGGTTLLYNFFNRIVIPDYAFEALGNKLIFLADGSSSASPTGMELWVSGGVTGVTQLLKDVVPGGTGSTIDGFVNVNGTLFFRAFENTDVGYRLWKTDGTAAGTARVAQVYPYELTAMNGLLYFATTDVAAPGLWRSDGTEAGTVRVSDALAFADVVASGGALYFFADSPSAGLWRSDGTQAGTVLVRALTGFRDDPTPFRGGLAFAAQDDTGANPWVTDGTTAGTVRLGPFDDRTLGSWPFGTSAAPASAAPVQVGERTLFPAIGRPQGLWATDGTTGGTVPLAPLAGYRVVGLAAARRREGTDFAYVLAWQAGQDPSLWTTDGTDAGTVMVRHVLLPQAALSRAVDSLAVLDGVLYFSGDLPEDRRGSEPMKSDGTAAGTVRVKDVYDGGNGTFESDPANLTASGGLVYFTARLTQTNNELWRTDGTAGGTVKLKAFTSSPGQAAGIARALADVDGTLMLLVAGGTRQVLWKSDGTAAGTAPVAEFASTINGTVGPIVAFGGAAYFPAAESGEQANIELWKSDGTPGGTLRVSDVNPGAGGSAPASLTALGDRLYFTAQEPQGGRELWATDGTEGGTYRVADVVSGPEGSSPLIVGAAGDRVYFAATDAAHGTELWSSDGTERGAELVEDVVPGPRGSGPVFATSAGRGVIFWANDVAHGLEPWVTPTPAPAVFIVGRHVFYNHSAFDGRDVAVNHGDDSAVATDKEPLLPREVPSFRNVTSYARGINGVMVDVNTRFAAFEALQFSFRVNSGQGWVAGPQPLEVVARGDHLPLDLERYEITWADGAIRNEWLEVTVETVSGGVTTAADVFYFGNLVGDTGSAGATMRVDASDYSQTRAHLRSGAAIDSPYDFNRDARVDALDLSLVRANLFHSLQPPALESPIAASPALAARPAARRRSAWIDEVAAAVTAPR